MGKATCNALFRTVAGETVQAKDFWVKNASAWNNSQIHFEFFIVLKLEKRVENHKKC